MTVQRLMRYERSPDPEPGADEPPFYQCAFKDIRMRCGAALYEGASPNPSTKNFFNMSASDAELL